MHYNNKLQHVDVGKSKRSNNTQQNMEKILYAHLCLVYLPRIRVQWIFEKYPCCKIQNDLQIHAYMIFQLKPFSYLVKTISMLRMSIMEADNPLYQKININTTNISLKSGKSKLAGWTIWQYTWKEP